MCRLVVMMMMATTTAATTIMEKEVMIMGLLLSVSSADVCNHLWGSNALCQCVGGFDHCFCWQPVLPTCCLTSELAYHCHAHIPWMFRYTSLVLGLVRSPEENAIAYVLQMPVELPCFLSVQCVIHPTSFPKLSVRPRFHPSPTAARTRHSQSWAKHSCSGFPRRLHLRLI